MKNNTRENQIENYLKLQAERFGGLCLKFKSAYAGAPDRIVILDGKVAFVELKRPKGGKLSSLQKYWARKLAEQGCLYALLKNKQEVDHFILAMRLGVQQK